MAANSVFGVLSWFSPIILGFVSTPIIVKGLGTENYGVYAIIIGFLSYSFTFGIGRAASKYIAEYTASNEREKISQSLSAVLIFSTVVGILGAAALAILTPWVVSSLLLLPESQRATAETGLYIASITGLMLMISQVFQNTLQGMHRFGTYLLYSNLGAIILSSGNIALALAGYGIPALLAWNLFSVLTTGILFFVAALQAVPDFRPTIKISRDIFRAVLRYGSGIILYQIFANILFIFERTWIVRNFGSEALTFYSVPMVLAIYLHGFIASFALVLFPRLNEFLNDRAQMVRLYRRSNRLVIAVITLAATSLIVSGREFLSLWVGHEFGDRSSVVLVLHVLTFSLIASTLIVWSIAEAFRATGLNVALTFIWLVVGSGLMIYFGSSYGIEGPAAARLAAVILTLPIIFYSERRFLGTIQVAHWLVLITRVIAAAICVAAIQILVSRLLPFGWFQFASSVSVGVAVYCIVLFLTGFFEKEEIDRVKGMVSRLV